VLLEDLPAERLHFALENDLEAGPLQAEVQAPDSTEEGRNSIAQGFSPRYGTLQEPLCGPTDSVNHVIRHAKCVSVYLW